MADNKKYYYLKLKDNFFDSDEIRLMETMTNGYKYSNILLKLYLKSLTSDGRLMFKDKIPYNEQMIATITNHDIDVVRSAIKLFKEFNLIEILDNGAIYMLDIQNFIGESSTEADRKRLAYNKMKNEKNMLTGDFSEISPPEIELEKELEIENNIYSSAKPNNVSEIINYLNEKANTNYRSSSSKTQTLIRARENEKFTLEDFKAVIDKKTKEWKGSDMEKYLRPETLFGTKFEGYLNSKDGKPTAPTNKWNIDYA